MTFPRRIDDVFISEHEGSVNFGSCVLRNTLDYVYTRMIIIDLTHPIAVCWQLLHAIMHKNFPCYLHHIAELFTVLFASKIYPC